jgi:hypothetical protein
MWRCPRCQSNVEDSFEVCWSCGTTPEGIEDPTFVTADDAEPIEEPNLYDKFDESLEDFAGMPLPDLVECYMASNTIEAKFVADRLMEQGIPALADRHDVWGSVPKVRIRPEDLPRAQVWLAEYEQRQKAKQDE